MYTVHEWHHIPSHMGCVTVFTSMRCVQEADGEEEKEGAEEKPSETDRRFALQFTVWFYGLLNAWRDAAQAVSVGSDVFGAHHFYPRCRLRLLCFADDHRIDNFSGAELVAQRLQALVREEDLQLMPNTDDDGRRLNIYSDIHGLKVVVACGTIHKGASPVGVFEQNFGVVQDPNAENKWRIQFMNLMLKGAAEQPCSIEGWTVSQDGYRHKSYTRRLTQLYINWLINSLRRCILLSCHYRSLGHRRVRYARGIQ